MAIDMVTFNVSQEEITLLREAVKMDEPLLKIIESGEVNSVGKLTLNMKHEYAQELRSHLTEQLARIGFTTDYALTKDGEIIEGLIDKFFIA